MNLDNTINRFALLSSSQYFENRVYEDRDDVATATEEEKKKEEEEEEKDTAAAAPLDNMREAIKVGMEGLKFYVGEDDSGDATDQYNDTPLPYIIGTEEFINDGNEEEEADDWATPADGEDGSTSTMRRMSSRSVHQQEEKQNYEYSSTNCQIE